MKIQSIVLSIFMLMAVTACSGTKSAGAGNSPSSQANAPSSRSTGNESASSGAFRNNKKADTKTYQRTHADLVKEAEERQEENAKRREKEAKLAEKPQYSDPSYFGHKKKPKKRPVGKRKMCKECGIVH